MNLLILTDRFKIVEPMAKLLDEPMAATSKMSNAISVLTHDIWQNILRVDFCCIKWVSKAHSLTNALHILISKHRPSCSLKPIKNFLQHLSL